MITMITYHVDTFWLPTFNHQSDPTKKNLKLPSHFQIKLPESDPAVKSLKLREKRGKSIKAALAKKPKKPAPKKTAPPPPKKKAEKPAAKK